VAELRLIAHVFTAREGLSPSISVFSAFISPASMTAVGVDEWAWRRGRRFGTILVDLVSHRILDLLP
jgi:hypothetical protein